MKIAPISFTRISKTIQIPNQNINKISFVQKADSVHFGNIKKEETQQKIIILAGAPNSGKGTTAGILSKKYNIPAISMGDLLREEIAKETPLGKEIKPLVANGVLIPEEKTHAIFVKRTQEPDCAKGYIIDGFPRTIKQAELMQDYLATQNAKQMVFNLDVEKEILYERCEKRFLCNDCHSIYSIDPKEQKENPIICDCGGKLIKRPDDNKETLDKRLNTYETQTMPVIDYLSEFMPIHQCKVTSNTQTAQSVVDDYSNLFDEFYSAETN